MTSSTGRRPSPSQPQVDGVRPFRNVRGYRPSRAQRGREVARPGVTNQVTMRASAERPPSLTHDGFPPTPGTVPRANRTLLRRPTEILTCLVGT